jgi:hypothetical protein
MTKLTKPRPSKTAEITVALLMAPFILTFGACAMGLIGMGLILMKLDEKKDNLKKWFRNKING